MTTLQTAFETDIIAKNVSTKLNQPQNFHSNPLYFYSRTLCNVEKENYTNNEQYNNYNFVLV